MHWDFLMVVRDKLHSDEKSWGDLFVKSLDDRRWERFSYAYELPWKVEKTTGKSRKGESRVKLGTYAMSTRSDGNKGWRLELKGTGHREHIQVHRAHHSMYIEGCILPVHFSGFDDGTVNQGSMTIEEESVKLMRKLQVMYLDRAKRRTGEPTITIAADLLVLGKWMPPLKLQPIRPTMSIPAPPVLSLPQL